MPLLIQCGSILVNRPRGVSWRQYARDVAGQLGLSTFQTLCSLAFLPHQAYLMADAISRTVVRVFITRRNLLEWESAYVTEQKTKGSLRFYIESMWFAPAARLRLRFSAAMWRFTLAGPANLLLGTGAFWCAAPLCLVWFASPALAWWLSQPFHREPSPLNDEERLELRLIARRTWLFFETFVGEADHWLPPDNFQESPKPAVAHRTSPTNEGLLLVSALAAHDFGYLGSQDLLGRLERNLDNWTSLPHYRGHPYNWYDTAKLEPLQPIYISTVDSGNLAASALSVRQGVTALPDESLFRRANLTGLSDTLALLQETVDDEAARPPNEGASNDLARGDSPGPRLKSLVQKLANVEALAPADPLAWHSMLAEIEAAAAPILAMCGGRTALSASRAIRPNGRRIRRRHLANRVARRCRSNSTVARPTSTHCFPGFGRSSAAMENASPNRAGRVSCKRSTQTCRWPTWPAFLS